MTAEQRMLQDAKAMFDTGIRLGCPFEQLEHFVNAGIFLQEKQLMFSRAARECDKEGGPTIVSTGGGRGSGKALSCGTPIPTPSGWSNIEDLRVGDTVFDETGKPCSVMSISGVQLNRKCYEVEFSCGQTIIADEEHLWFTATKGERKAITRRSEEFRAARRLQRSGIHKQVLVGKNLLPYPPLGSVKTTAQIRDTVTIPSGREKNHAVKVSDALQLPEKAFPLDPYLLGLWLGDGTSANGGYTTNDEELWKAFEQGGFEVTKRKQVYGYGILGLEKLVRLMGMMKNKHIPEGYLRGSFEQRLSLLQGLMDTDGTVDYKGHSSFCNTNKRIIDSFLELCASLGIKTSATKRDSKLYGRVVNQHWVCCFHTHLPVFRLERKLKRQKRDGFNPVSKTRYITAVREVPSTPVCCIGVDSPSHCYLAGRSMIVTHNSAGVSAQILLDDCQRQNDLKVLMLRKIGKSGLEQFNDIRLKLLRDIPHHWQGQKGVLTFDKTGSRVIVGNYKDESDIDQYLGLEYDIIFIEECTQLTFDKVKNLLSCLRTSKTTWRPRAYFATNPGGKGHGWFKKMCVDPWRSKKQNGTRHIQVTIHDNKYCNSDYRSFLESLTGWKRRAWLDGDWDIMAGQFFTTWRENVHVIQEFNNGNAKKFMGSLDYGWTHPTVFYLGAQDYDGNLIAVDEHFERQTHVDEHCHMIKNMLAKHGLRPEDLGFIVAGRDCFTKKEDGHTIADQYADNGIRLLPAEIDRVNRWAELLRRLGDPEGGIKPRLYVHKRCKMLIEQIPAALHDEKNPEDVAKMDADEETGLGGDDALDAFGFMCSANYKKGEITFCAPISVGGLEKLVGAEYGGRMISG